MARSRAVRGTAAAAVLAIMAVLVVVSSRRETAGHPDDDASAQAETYRNPADRRIEVAANPLQLLIELGREDERQQPWDGEIRVSDGKVLAIEVVRGARNSEAEGSKFKVRAQRAGRKRAKKKKKQRADLLSAILRVQLDAPADAKITVSTGRGEFSFQPQALTPGRPRTFLDGQASVERETASLKLTGPNSEDDFPALAKAKDGTAWLAYVEYKRAGEVIMEQVENGRYDSLEPKGHGDRIRLVRFDGKTWEKPINVTEGGLDVWRPTVAVDGSGNVVVAWAEKKDGDWDIFYRTYVQPAKKEAGRRWSEITRVSDEKGSDFHVVSTTDADGVVWLAWQGWRDGRFVIHAKPLDGGSATHTFSVQKPGKNANNWTPSIAADSKGAVYVAFDTYAQENYDVYVVRLQDGEIKYIPVAESPRFEAKPHVVCDADDRLWIAYELSDLQWGKDYQGNAPEKVGIGENPGYGLYVNRTVQVRCLEPGRAGLALKRPAGDVEKAFTDRLQRAKSLPRLAVDRAGGVWMFFRHHPLSGGRGEAWHSYWTRYDGKAWSPARELPDSSNILDNRPALLSHQSGVLVVHSSDTRTATRDRDQDDLYAATLTATASPVGASIPDGASIRDAASRNAVSLVAARSDEDADKKLKPVHPNEDESVAAVRNYRLKIGGKVLRPVRGEFHRHTEYTAHRDQDGTLEDSWRYALDAGKLDWMGNGDHDNGFGHEYLWWQIQKICDLFHNPPHFLAAMTYERSVRYPSGHRNVMFSRRGIRPLPRLSNQRDRLMGTKQGGSPDIKLLYKYLAHFGGICAIHTSGTNMGTDWRDNDPEVEPIVEIYQGHRHNYEHFGAPRSATRQTQIGGYQPAGAVWNALAHGYRLGFQASSDHVSTHMSYGVPLVEEFSRQGIIDAFKKRHCYAATDNILLVVRSGEHLMGDEFTTPQRPSLEIDAAEATNLARVHVIRDHRYVYTAEPNQRRVSLTWSDMDAQPGATHYYYVRAEQDDGNLAWASPMWITWKK